MARSIEELQDEGVEPDVWQTRQARRLERIVASPRRQGRDKVGCIILGRGEDDTKVREWLTTAAAVPGFLGFAVGRTSFWEPPLDWRAATIDRNGAVTDIARRYRQFVEIFETHQELVPA